MQKQEIEIQLHPDGKLEYTVKGIKGSACDSIGELLEQLGSKEYEAKTGEYYEYGDETHIAIGGE